MLPGWLFTSLPTWLVVFIVLYAIAALYVAIKYREVRNFSQAHSSLVQEYFGICG